VREMLTSGEKHRSEPVVEAIDGKIFAICCEDFADAFALGGTDQSRVRHVHRAIGILAHQFSHAGNVSWVKGEKVERASL